MELTTIRGIGDAYAARLRSAGIRNVSDLAATEDLSTLSEATGIPPAKLAGLRADAMLATGGDHRSPMDVVHSVASAVLELAEEARGLALTRALEGVRWLKRRMASPPTRRGKAA